MPTTIENQKIQQIKKWLNNGSINIFGLPMSGKDTVGKKLANILEGEFISSGDIIRKLEQEQNLSLTNSGELAPTKIFTEIVLPYFHRVELKNKPLILSSVGRWSGEEDSVIREASNSNHPIKAVILLNLSGDAVIQRWQELKNFDDRGGRLDDGDLNVLKNRLKEFENKTKPVLLKYHQLNLLIEVNGEQSRDEVFSELITKLYLFINNNHG